MTEAPGARRRRLDSKQEEKDPGRSGCLWLGGVLGVVAGVLFAFFAMPPLLDVLFPPEHVAAGETFNHEGRVATVRELRAIEGTPADPRGSQRWRVMIELTARKSWTLKFDTFQLRLDSGDEVNTAAFETKDFTPDGSADGLRLPLGQPTVLTLQFIAPNGSPPVKLILDEPQVEFDLPPPSQP